jgi:hypothetical protein
VSSAVEKEIMSRAHRFVLPFLAVMIARAPFLSGAADEANMDRDDPVPAFAKLERGMTPQQVRQLVGAPKQISRQILYHRYREQWIYDAPFPVRLAFDCRRGQKPQLLFPPEVPGKAEPRP